MRPQKLADRRFHDSTADRRLATNVFGCPSINRSAYIPLWARRISTLGRWVDIPLQIWDLSAFFDMRNAPSQRSISWDLVVVGRFFRSETPYFWPRFCGRSLNPASASRSGQLWSRSSSNDRRNCSTRRRSPSVNFDLPHKKPESLGVSPTT